MKALTGMMVAGLLWGSSMVLGQDVPPPSFSEWTAPEPTPAIPVEETAALGAVPSRPVLAPVPEHVTATVPEAGPAPTSVIQERVVETIAPPIQTESCPCRQSGAMSPSISHAGPGYDAAGYGAAVVPQRLYDSPTPPITAGLHERYPYYSYRRPWYTPGAVSQNVTIVW